MKTTMILTLAMMALTSLSKASHESCTYGGREYSHGAEHHGQQCSHGSWR